MHHYTKFQNIALVVLRIIVAAIFIVAAYYKLPFWSGPIEGVSAGMASLMKLLTVLEPLGAIAVLMGFLTRWAAAGLSIIMVGAVFVMQFSMQVGFTTAAGAGWNFPLVVLAGCIVLTAFGAGCFSIDERRTKGAQIDGGRQ